MATIRKKLSRAELNELEDVFIQCRLLGHAWEEIPDTFEIGPTRVYRQSATVDIRMFRCERCTKLRREAWYKVTRKLLFRVYKNPENYTVHGFAYINDVRGEYTARFAPMKKRSRSAA